MHHLGADVFRVIFLAGGNADNRGNAGPVGCFNLNNGWGNGNINISARHFSLAGFASCLRLSSLITDAAFLGYIP
jgi:hypothetical protein